MSKKTVTKPKGLTDKQLIAKYESGKMPVRKVMLAMLKTPPPTELEKRKQR